MKFRWRKDFLEEVEAAADFYQQRSPAVMHRFLAQFDKTLLRIAGNPMLGQACGGAQRSRVFAFPFDIIYLQHLDVIVLIALSHHSRRPGYWHDRLRS